MKLYWKKTPKRKVLQRIKTIEERITRLKRTIRHLTKMINFKKTGIKWTQKKSIIKNVTKQIYIHSNLNLMYWSKPHGSPCARSVKLKYQKKRHKRKLINPLLKLINLFSNIPNVEKKCKNRKKLSTKESIVVFWKGMGEKNPFNHNARWLKQLESIYCSSVIPTDYDITLQLVNQIVSKVQLQNCLSH